MLNVQVSEIFYSLSGEARDVGRPTTFIRLVGCPLRCGYCDTSYAFYGGSNYSFEDILKEISKYSTKYVLVTGGEPLAQKNTLKLLSFLCDSGYKVSLETSGHLDISLVDLRVDRIIDVKTPGSGESQSNLLSNYDILLKNDQLKFVICDREDYQWSKEFIQEHRLDEKCDILFSPSYNEISEQELADWILQDQLSVRFQLQLHKTLWGDIAGK